MPLRRGKFKPPLEVVVGDLIDTISVLNMHTKNWKVQYNHHAYYRERDKVTKEEIVQALLDTKEDKKYLEIGNHNNKSFAIVDAKYKSWIGVEEKSPEVGTIKYDVIFVNNLHEYQQAYKCIIGAFEHLVDDGAIVVNNCLPKNKEMGLPPREYDLIDRTIKKKNGWAWTGDVWRAIVKLRCSQRNVEVYTLNCDWGCAVITKGEPEVILNLSDVEAQTMEFEEFYKNRKKLLNIKKPKYLIEKIFEQRGQKVPEFYAENPMQHLLWCVSNRCSIETVEAQVVEKGALLPLKVFKVKGGRNYKGGIIDKNGKFVTGDRSNHNKLGLNTDTISAYDVSEGDFFVSDDTVVFGGCVGYHFGHVLVDDMSRWWWLAQNPDYKGKIALLKKRSGKMLPIIVQLLALLGIEEKRILVIDKPTRFAKVIIPSQAFFRMSGYNAQFLEAFDKIGSNVNMFVPRYEKIYLTRRQLERKDMINEDYFENFFESQGYKIISPEKLSIHEQIATIRGASEIACIKGTLSHLVLFARTGVKLKLLMRSHAMLYAQSMINQARNVDATFVDVSMNFLPTSHVRGAFLLMPTYHWERFAKDYYEAKGNNLELGDYVVDYIKMWTETYKNPNNLQWIGNKSVEDFIELFNCYFLDD